MTNEEFITQNKDKDIRSLALKKMPEGVDSLWCLTQIEGYQLAKKKLPSWADTQGLWFPPRLSMEQCSSEATALYKKNIIDRLSASMPYTLTDITGGFGVDFSYMARDAAKATYIEIQETLCNVARHNFPLLGLPNAEIINGQFPKRPNDQFPKRPNTRFIFADPARRDDAGRKTVAIEDCTPNIVSLQDSLLSAADYIIIKLSPMLDITQALRSLRCVTEVHVVSVKGECKELLFVLSSKAIANKSQDITYHCVNLNTKDKHFICSTKANTLAREQLRTALPTPGMLLFEPNASIMKAGVQEAFARHYGLHKIHAQSNLYTSPVSSIAPESDCFPSRTFVITDVCDFSKASLKTFLCGIRQANLTIRNFPSTVADLRKRLKIKEGGSIYLFATTLEDGSHALIKCEKAT